MINKKLVVISVLIAVFAGIGLSFVKGKKPGQVNSSQFVKKEKLKIAACPTCFEMVKTIDAEKYEIIKTGSTAESLALLENKKVDMILAGRTLKPTEQQMEYILIEDGYSFLSNKESIVYRGQLKDYTIFTDLDIETVKNAFAIENVEQVNNVYQYLDKGIVITSWENTDYTKASIVHVFENNGERVKLSRRPTIYCPDKCDKNAEGLALLLKEGMKGKYIK